MTKLIFLFSLLAVMSSCGSSRANESAIQQDSVKDKSFSSITNPSVSTTSISDSKTFELDDDEIRLADAIASNVSKEPLISEAEAKCFGESNVAELGVKRLNELGVNFETLNGLDSQESAQENPQELTVEERSAFAEIMVRCYDPRNSFVIEGYSLGFTREEASCVYSELEGQDLKPLLIKLFMKETTSDSVEKIDEFIPMLIDAATKCETATPDKFEPLPLPSGGLAVENDLTP